MHYSLRLESTPLTAVEIHEVRDQGTGRTIGAEIGLILKLASNAVEQTELDLLHARVRNITEAQGSSWTLTQTTEPGVKGADGQTPIFPHLIVAGSFTRTQIPGAAKEFLASIDNNVLPLEHQRAIIDRYREVSADDRRSGVKHVEPGDETWLQPIPQPSTPGGLGNGVKTPFAPALNL